MTELSSENSVSKAAEYCDGITHTAASPHGNKSHKNEQSDLTRSSKDHDVVVEEMSSENEAVLVENEFEKDCYGLSEDSANGEKQLLVQEHITDKIIDRDLANGTLNGRSVKDLEGNSSFPNHNLKKLNDENVKDPCAQMAENIIQDIFARIGCYENFIRCASWADEPNNGREDLSTIVTPCKCAELHKKVQ